MTAPETLTLRATAIAGERYADDFAIRWRGLPIGRIFLGVGCVRLCSRYTDLKATQGSCWAAGRVN
jgi:hypothetical protein